jgi:hypothetical protein
MQWELQRWARQGRGHRDGGSIQWVNSLGTQAKIEGPGGVSGYELHISCNY